MGYKTYTCPVAKKCGACEWLAVPYPIQLERKHEAMQELFGSIDCEVEPVVGMDEPCGYRAKIMAPFVRGRGGYIKFGMYERGTHQIIETPECLVEFPQGHAILQTIAVLARKFHIEPYHEDTGRGLLRHGIVRVARSSGACMVTLVINRKEFPRKKAFVAELRKRHPEIETIVFNVNTRQTNAVLGPTAQVAFGQGWIEDEVCDCRFRIPALAFYQTNPEQTEKLYSTAVDLARIRPGDVVFDAYCGIGTIGIIAAKRAKATLVGVESVPDAVKIARDNARTNKVHNATFVEGDAGEYLAKTAALLSSGAGIVQAAERGLAVPDVVFMDPPRAGASEEFLQALLTLGPKRVVYVSCNPVTQVRDLEVLGNAYRVKRIVPVDMFPHTKHVECVCLMCKA